MVKIVSIVFAVAAATIALRYVIQTKQGNQPPAPAPVA